MVRAALAQIHGGNLLRLSEAAGMAEERLLDFSASINPLGMPRQARQAIGRALQGLGHYPDTEARRLRQAISERYSIEDRSIIVANGSTELIYLIPRALRPGRVLVTAPAFSEFERAALLSGARVRRLALRKHAGFSIDPGAFIDAMKGSDMAILCNPNNPTGRMLGREEVLETARAARRNRCVLVVDEAFMDFCPGGSVLGEKNPYLIVLRSLTKFYALAGLRLGFGFFPAGIRRKIEGFKEPWSVNTLAQAAGTAALGDSGFATRTLGLIKRERNYLVKALDSLGMRTYPSDANYILAVCRDSAALTRGLIKSGIAVRDCSNFRGLGRTHVRIAVRSRRENDALLGVLQKIYGRPA